MNLKELKKTYYENYGMDIHARDGGRLADDVWEWLEGYAFKKVREEGYDVGVTDSVEEMHGVLAEVLKLRSTNT